jgi:hypothetical protein
MPACARREYPSNDRRLAAILTVAVVTPDGRDGAGGGIVRGGGDWTAALRTRNRETIASRRGVQMPIDIVNY